MITDKCVKWSEEAVDFFQSAQDKSITLDLVISHGCLSQTGEGFEELVNAINVVKRKIKLVNITDTSYLYRHGIQKFSEYCDPNIPTIWFLNNCETIEKLEVDKTVKAWADGLKNDEFKKWNRQIRIDFAGDDNGDGIVQRFRDIVMQESAVAVYKTGNALKDCVDFLLEECAYVCSNLRNSALVYPSSPPESVLNCSKRYNANLLPLSYKISKQAQRSSKCYEYLKSEEILDKEIALFMKKIVSNVNFFVIDKYGNHIYKNYAYSKISGNINAKIFHQKAWTANTQVMKTKKETVIEEIYGDTCYLSVKAPLIIDGEVEGVIGLSVDITDRKKLRLISEQIVHDVTSPLLVLSALAQNCKSLPETEHIALRNAITSIESIMSGLIGKFEENADFLEKDMGEEAYVCINLTLPEMIENKKRQYKEQNAKFNYKSDSSRAFVFVRGDYFCFCRMISNLLNNSIDAAEGKKGIIDVSFTAKDKKVEIHIKDNGKGMPQEVIDKIVNNEQIDSMKPNGHGIGMQQIRSVLKAMNGEMSIKSKENVGTEIMLSFPKCDAPQWFSDKIVLSKGDTVVVMDDDPSIHDIWKSRFADYADDITVKYFTQGRETINFINSIKEKNKVFLIADYELRRQDFNGVEVIEKSGMQNRAIIVTSVYVSRIEDFSKKCKIFKMFPKMAGIDSISIIIQEKKNEKGADFVFIDDDESVVNALCVFLEERGLKADAYNSADAFLSNLYKYPKDTKIVADHELKQGGNGFDLLEKLHEAGYSRLYLMSGRSFENQNPPPYITVILKDAAVIKKLLQAN